MSVGGGWLGVGGARGGGVKIFVEAGLGVGVP